MRSEVVIPFAPRVRTDRARAWRPDEIAEVYRVIDLLGRAGLGVFMESGCSDEGDPWLVVLRDDTHDVVVHIARIDGQIAVVSCFSERVFYGPTLTQALRSVIGSQPLMLPNGGAHLFLHPATLLAAFIATALAHSVAAATTGDAPGSLSIDSSGGAVPDGGPRSPSDALQAARAVDADKFSVPLIAVALASVAATVALTYDALLPAHDLSDMIRISLQTVAGLESLPVQQTSQTTTQAGLGAWIYGGVVEPFNEEQNGPVILADAQLLEADLPSMPSLSPAGVQPELQGGAKLAALSEVLDGAAVTNGPFQNDAGAPFVAATPPPSPSVGFERMDLFGGPPQEATAGLAMVREVAAVPEVNSGQKVVSLEKITFDGSAWSGEKAYTDNGAASSTLSTPGEQGLTFALAGGEVFYWKGALLLGLFDSRTADVTASESKAAAQSAPVVPESNDPTHLAHDAVAEVASQLRPEFSTKIEAVVLEVTKQPSAAEKAKILGEFAHDSSRELAVSNLIVHDIRDAVTSNPFLPSVDKVILFEAASVGSDVFMLMPGVAMVRSDLVAADQLAAVAQHPVELDLPNGAALRLLGVIDI